MRQIIADIFNCKTDEISGLEPLKMGMTNDSFIFEIAGSKKRYIIRIPGVGTDKLIDRYKEHAVYQVITPFGFCDGIVHLDPLTGHKVTEYWENARVCDILHSADIAASMAKLREFHTLNLIVPHTFCPFERIEYYESLWEGNPSHYADYAVTKAAVMRMKAYVDAQDKLHCLTHIDAVPDNFIFLPDGQIKLIDWEYAAMADPHLDIAMFIVYAMYDRVQTEQLIDHYFTGTCTMAVRRKIYAYIAICGLLWSNWCEYKKMLGEDFGEYALKQYGYAKEYYKIFEEITI